MFDLRQELEARSLSPKGLKSQLIARLTKILRVEQEKEEKGIEEVRVIWISMYSVSQKILPPKIFWQYFPQRLWVLKYISCMFISMQNYKILFNYLVPY